VDTAATISSGISPNRFRELDFIRGILAIFVLIAHYVLFGNIPYVVHGGFCVNIFFILSGFVMSHAYGRKIGEGKIGLGSFALLRLGRLYPLMFFCSILVMLAYALLYSTFRTEKGYGIIDTIFMNLFMLQGINSDRWGLNDAFWSLGVEFWVGLTLFYGVIRYKAYFVNFLIISALLFYEYAQKRGLFFGIDVGLISPLTRNGLLGIGLGIIVYQIYAVFEKSKAHTPIIWALKGIFYFLCAITASFILVSKNIDIKIADIYIEIIAAVSILLRALLKNQCKLFCAKWQSWLGDISYSVYVYHWIIIWFAWAWVAKENYGAQETIIGGVFVLIITLIVSRYSSKYIEKPAYKWFRAKIGR
jgi:peptidoglycan/LPS O-acetylase OafA/YrhL